MTKTLAPIVLFVYNRPEHTRRTVEALQENIGAAESDLIIYSDGPKPGSEEKVAQVREYIKTVNGFNSVTIIERDKNHGLADSIISGVTETLERYGKVIVLEDDLITSVYFLRFMNDALLVFEPHKNVYSVTGYMFPIDYPIKKTVLLPYVSTWGWATWKDRWAVFEKDMDFRENIASNKRISERFNLADYDYTSMLNLSSSRSWGIKWYYTIFRRNGLNVFPTRSFIGNAGFDGTGENCLATERRLEILCDEPISVIYDEGMDIEFLGKYLDHFSVERPMAKEKQMSVLSWVQKLKNIIKYLRNGNARQSFLSFCSIGEDSDVSAMYVDVRMPEAKKIFLKIGDHAIVGGRFVFENRTGRIIVGNNTFIGNSLFVSVDQISIGSNVLISWGCTFIDTNAHSLLPDERKQDVADWKRGLVEGKIGKYKNWDSVAHAPIIIEDHAWIGFNSIVLKGVTIGKGAVVGAGSVVTKDVPPYTVVAGNPARVVRQIEKKDQREER